MVCRVQRPISIPEPTNDVDSLWRTTQVLKEAVEIIQGIRGNREYALKCDLEDLNANVTNITVGDGGTGSDTLVGLIDTDLTGQLQYDLFYNIDGVNWGATKGELQWNPDDNYLQLANDHSINWVDSLMASVQMLNFRNDSFYVGNYAYPLELRGTFVGIPFNVGVNWDNSLGANVELLNLSGLPGSPAVLDSWDDVNNFTAASPTSTFVFNITSTRGCVYTPDGEYIYVPVGETLNQGGLYRTGALSTPFVPEATNPVNAVLARDNVTYPAFFAMAFNVDGTSVYLMTSNSATDDPGYIVEWTNSGTPFKPGLGDLTKSTNKHLLPVETRGGLMMEFNADHSRLWVVGGNGIIFEYELTTPGDITTINNTQVASWGTATGITAPPNNVGGNDGGGTVKYGMRMAPDGEKMYVMTATAAYQWNLSTPFDIESATYSGNSFSFNRGPGNQNYGVDISPDGRHMISMAYWGNNSFNNQIGYNTNLNWESGGSPATEGETVFTVGDPNYPTEIDGTRVGLKNNIGINWDNASGNDVELAIFAPGALIGTGLPNVDTNNYDSVSTAGVFTTEVQGYSFNGDGTVIFVSEIAGNTIRSHPLSTAYDLTTIGAQSATSPQLGGASTDYYPVNHWWGDNGNKFYVTQFNRGIIAQYNPTVPYDVTALGSVVNTLNFTTSDATAMWFSRDGTRMVVGDDTAEVYSYTLSVPWELSTATSFGTSKDLGTTPTVLSAIVLSEDGTTLWAMARGSDTDVYQWTLSTPFDPDSATYDTLTLTPNTAEPNATAMFVRSGAGELYIGYYATPAADDCIIEKYLFDPVDVSGGNQYVLGDPGYDTQIDGIQTKVTGDLKVDGSSALSSDVSVGGSIAVSGASEFFAEAQFNSKINVDVVTVETTTYTVGNEHVILVDDDTAGAAVTVTLPPAATANTLYHVKKIGATAEVIIDGNAAETIDGELTITLRAQYESVMLASNGTFWSIL